MSVQSVVPGVIHVLNLFSPKYSPDHRNVNRCYHSVACAFESLYSKIIADTPLLLMTRANHTKFPWTTDLGL